MFRRVDEFRGLGHIYQIDTKLPVVVTPSMFALTLYPKPFTLYLRPDLPFTYFFIE